MLDDKSEKGLETLIMRHMSSMEGLNFTQDIASDVPSLTGCTGYYDGIDHEKREHAKRVHAA